MLTQNPKVYTASKVHRAPMWRDLRDRHSSLIEFTSSWIDMDPLDDHDPNKCRDGWIANILDVQRSNYLLCYAEQADPLSGTLVEIGVMLTYGPVILTGDYDWKTWRHHPKVLVYPHSVEAALLHILQLQKENH